MSRGRSSRPRPRSWRHSCVVCSTPTAASSTRSTKGSAYVGLGSISIELLAGHQRLLSTFGISSRIYNVHRAARVHVPLHRQGRRRTALPATAELRPADLRAEPRTVRRRRSGSRCLGSQHAVLARARADRRASTTSTRRCGWSSGPTKASSSPTTCPSRGTTPTSSTASSCGTAREYLQPRQLSACNLASINLLQYLDDDGTFDVGAFTHTVDVVFTAQEILVGRADYPTEQIGDTTRAFRQLGLGFANLGALLMALGLPYDSDEGRAWAAEITSLMAGTAYGASARIAARLGPVRRIRRRTPSTCCACSTCTATRARRSPRPTACRPNSSRPAGRRGTPRSTAPTQHGVRNSQAVVIAPTGTIGLAMDCDTTGIEPDLALVKTKKLVGGGTMSIVNQTIPRALRRLGYSPDQIDEIVAYIDEHHVGRSARRTSRAEHVPVFACSMGDNTIHYEGHVRMMAAVQPFVSGAICKTINCPSDVTVDEIADLHRLSWELGLKSVAIYRDNSKVGQPLSTSKPRHRRTEAVEVGARRHRRADHRAGGPPAGPPEAAAHPHGHARSSSASPTARASPPSASTTTASPARSSSPCRSRAPPWPA